MHTCFIVSISPLASSSMSCSCPTRCASDLALVGDPPPLEGLMVLSEEENGVDCGVVRPLLPAGGGVEGTEGVRWATSTSSCDLGIRLCRNVQNDASGSTLSECASEKNPSTLRDTEGAAPGSSAA